MRVCISDIQLASAQRPLGEGIESPCHALIGHDLDAEIALREFLKCLVPSSTLGMNFHGLQCSPVP